MLPDFELIQHSFPGGHDITIIPIADVHLGNPGCMEQQFISFIKTVKESPNVYLILGGDLIENGTRNSIGDAVFRQTMPPSDQKKEMAQILEPVRDRILCMTDGNHERRSAKDTDDSPTYDIAAKLDLEHLYRPNICFVNIQLGNVGKKNFNGVSPFMQVAKPLGHITAWEKGILRLYTGRKTKRYYSVMRFLMLQIGWMRNGTRSRKILYSALYQYTGDTTTRAQQLTRDMMYRLLDEVFKPADYITAYKEEADPTPGVVLTLSKNRLKIAGK